MIKPIKQNLVFGASTPQLYQNVAKTRSASSIQTQSQPQKAEENKSLGEKIRNTKRGFLNFVKGFNDVKDTTTGAVRGIVDGLIGASIVGVFGKNLKQHDGKFFETLGGVVKDVSSEACKVIRNIPSIITKRSPLNTVTTALKEPFKLAKKLKGNPWTIAAACATGAGIFAYRTIQGKITANKKNANLDHAVNEGHIPTK